MPEPTQQHLRIEYVPMSSLVPDPENPKRHAEDDIRRSIDSHGFLDPFEVDDRTGRLTAGHGRFEALKASKAAGQAPPIHVSVAPDGDWLVPVVRGHAFPSDTAARSYLVANNELSRKGGQDDLAMAKLLDSIKRDDEQLFRATGFDEAGFDALVKSIGDEAIQAGVPASPESPASNAEIELDEDALEDDLDILFKSPYPYFGGKARVAGTVWKALGNVKMYIEPFFGSGAVMLNRPQPFDGIETINDFDAMISNVWRSIQAAPDDVAKHADWPCLENDLHARHSWLVAQKTSLQAKLEGDPDFFDAKVAGWWLWGMALWIGSGFCHGDGPWQVVEQEDGTRVLVDAGISAGQGVKRQRVHFSNSGQGINRKLVHLRDAGRGVSRQLVADSGTDPSPAGEPGRGECGLYAWMRTLSDRLRRVRVCCGDWTRVCGGDSGDAMSHFFSQGEPVGVFLDPPYADTAGRDADIYSKDDLQVAHAVRDWAVKHGDDPRLRIVLAGYEDEHVMPASWRVVRWKAAGGMALLGKDDDSRGKVNCFRERLWLSPHCVPLRLDSEPA